MRILFNLFAGLCLLAAMACVRGTKSKDAETLSMVINHYLVPCVGAGSQLCYLAKIDNGTEWEFLYEGVDGFEYEWGKVYELEVAKSRRKNPMADQSAIAYKLISIRSAEYAPADETFPLRVKDADMVAIKKNVDGQFSLMGQYPVGCGSDSLCEDLERKLQTEAHITGMFQHSPDHRSLVLRSFKN